MIKIFSWNKAPQCADTIYEWSLIISKGPFNIYINKILIFFDHLPTSSKQIYSTKKYFYTSARSSEQLEWKAFSFFSISKQSDVSRYDSNIICTSTKKKQICQVWRAWLKKCPCHALEKFLMVKGMAASFFRLCLSNLVKSWNLMSTDTGENLVLISQTTFE